MDMTGTQPLSGPALSRRRKAAMVVQMLLADGRQLKLASMPDEVQLRLTRELGSLRAIDRDTLAAVATEFAEDLERMALVAPGGLDGALASIGPQLSPTAAARLREESARMRGGDPWVQVLALSVTDLVPLMTAESTEVAAVTLSKLPVGKAAELLGKLPGERARRITYAMSQTNGVSPEAVKRIGEALVLDYCTKPVPAFSGPVEQRVGAILNSSPAVTRTTVLEGLGDDDPTFAEQVRKAIFTWADIPARVEAVDVPKVIRGYDNSSLVTALAAALADGGPAAAVAEFILSNMSQRMADQLREEIEARGKVKKADGEQAQGGFVSHIRERADAGDISFIEPEGEEE